MTDEPLDDDEPATDAEQLQAAMAATVQAAILVMRRNGTKPLAGIAEIVGWIATEIENHAPPAAVREGMLIAFEALHPQPMTFIDINKCKLTLEKISAARKLTEGAKRGLIMPPGGTIN